MLFTQFYEKLTMSKLRSLISALAMAGTLLPAAHAAYSDKAFTITNTGNGALTLTNAAISGNTAEFALLPGHNCSTIAAGSSCSMTVRFTPAGSGARDDATLTLTSNGTNGTHSVALNGTGGLSCTPGKQVFSYTGGDQSFTMPAGCSTAIVKAWGAGGRGGYYSANGAGGGAGGGGFAQRTLTNLSAGSSLVVVVGQGGTGLTATYGGGGAGGVACSFGCGYGGAGGGLSGVFLGTKAQANALLIAGGGGGGYSVTGGAGGGSSGLTGGTPTSGTPGTGGTQSSGGAPGTGGAAGSPLQGGSGATASTGTGGGGGYWGGGGAGYGGAGGGSGYAPGGTLTAGSGCNTTNTGDQDYVDGIGKGGCSGNTNGQNGRVVIIWQ